MERTRITEGYFEGYEAAAFGAVLFIKYVVKDPELAKELSKHLDGLQLAKTGWDKNWLAPEL